MYQLNRLFTNLILFYTSLGAFIHASNQYEEVIKINPSNTYLQSYLFAYDLTYFILSFATHYAIYWIIKGKNNNKNRMITGFIVTTLLFLIVNLK
ncbi:MAG: hypothetical protein PHS49_07440 [Candidatus Gracilibacteria bacterium]|nr:hypothetical protein [Candidatus Gracilibacteria bacterium]